VTTQTAAPRWSTGFTLDEAARIRRMMSEQAAALTCPHCGARLHPTGGGAGEDRVWIVGCGACGLSVLLNDIG